MNQLIYDIRKNKVILVLISMIFFSFTYMFISDDEWFGVNKIKDIVKDEVVREKVEDIEITQKEIINFQNVEGFVDFSNFRITTNKSKVEPI